MITPVFIKDLAGTKLVPSNDLYPSDLVAARLVSF